MVSFFIASPVFLRDLLSRNLPRHMIAIITAALSKYKSCTACEFPIQIRTKPYMLYIKAVVVLTATKLSILGCNLIRFLNPLT